MLLGRSKLVYTHLLTLILTWRSALFTPKNFGRSIGHKEKRFASCMFIYPQIIQPYSLEKPSTLSTSPNNIWCFLKHTLPHSQMMLEREPRCVLLGPSSKCIGKHKIYLKDITFLSCTSVVSKKTRLLRPFVKYKIYIFKSHENRWIQWGVKFNPWLWMSFRVTFSCSFLMTYENRPLTTTI